MEVKREVVLRERGGSLAAFALPFATMSLVRLYILRTRRISSCPLMKYGCTIQKISLYSLGASRRGKGCERSIHTKPNIKKTSDRQLTKEKNEMRTFVPQHTNYYQMVCIKAYYTL